MHQDILRYSNIVQVTSEYFKTPLDISRYLMIFHTLKNTTYSPEYFKIL